MQVSETDRQIITLFCERRMVNAIGIDVYTTENGRVLNTEHGPIAVAGRSKNVYFNRDNPDDHIALLVTQTAGLTTLLFIGQADVLPILRAMSPNGDPEEILCSDA